ncbi:MAG: hypothetical protein ACIALR_06205 [Blastopirellula sp. JB062]
MFLFSRRDSISHKPRYLPHSLACGLTLLVGFAVGCGGGPSKSEVSGKITFDGKPIEMGQVIFEPADGLSVSGAGLIENGDFQLECPQGSFRVVITGTRAIPGAPPISNIPGEEIEARESYIPKKFNARTELTAEVVERRQTIDFDLRS